MTTRLSQRRMFAMGAAAVVAGAVVLSPPAARSVELNFAGSAQLDYLYVPTEDEAVGLTFDGFTTELSLKVAVDFSDEVAMSVKTCYGCHGFEIGNVYADVRLHDAFNVRVGRFTPSFGDFPDRHDPANHLTSDKPLPYDMGRMIRLRDWNMSVLPAPYVDNGVELGGRVGFGEDEDVYLDYAAYVVGGLRGGADAVDVDFIQSRSVYYIDNNSRPSVGGRLAVGIRLGELGSLKLGASALWGTYDPANELDTLILGTDLVLRIKRWTLRAEYLLRRTEMALGEDPGGSFRYGPGKDGRYDPYALKEGWYASTDVRVSDLVELVGRFDGMRRTGNVPIASKLRSESMVLRYTLGVNFVIQRALRIKLSAELYDFSDFDDEVGIHLGFVGAF